MVCPTCKSASITTIPAEIRLYKNAPRTISHPPFSRNPDVQVCLECGWSGFSIPTKWVSDWLQPIRSSATVSVPTLITEARRKTA
jgi:hypothetical protein